MKSNTQRYIVVEEPGGFAIHDTLTGGVIVRYALKSKAEIVCENLNLRD